jgi:SAM-dependent methyltransferase
VRLTEAGRLLDFGIGCGRVARHWRDLEEVEIHGTDYNTRLVQWCDDNLPFVHAARNQLTPPLGYPDGMFGAAYAISVLTHLPEGLQVAWMRELRRVLRPDGRLLVTTHGRPLASHMQPDERVRFERGEMVVRHRNAAGSNLCVTYHPHEWFISHLCDGFDVEQFIEGGTPGLKPLDIYVLRVSTGASPVTPVSVRRT